MLTHFAAGSCLVLVLPGQLYINFKADEALHTSDVLSVGLTIYKLLSLLKLGRIVDKANSSEQVKNSGMLLETALQEHIGHAGL